MKKTKIFQAILIILIILLVIDGVIWVLSVYNPTNNWFLNDKPAPSPTPTPTQSVAVFVMPTPTEVPNDADLPTDTPMPAPTATPLKYPEGYVPVEAIAILTNHALVGDNSLVFLSNRAESQLTCELSAIISPYNASSYMVDWTSSDETVARVGSDGHVVGLRNGYAYITARADEVSVSVRVLVERNYSSSTFWRTRYDIGYQHPIHADDEVNKVASLGGNYWFNSERHVDALDKQSTARSHAGFDLNVPAGTNVYAMFGGTVQSASSDGFYAGTGQITILHDDGTVIRYGEVTPVVTQGRVEKNQLIAVVKENDYGTQARFAGGNQFEHMLHLEVYFGFDEQGAQIKGNLSDKSTSVYLYAASPLYGGTFYRRADLVDPSGVETMPQFR